MVRCIRCRCRRESLIHRTDHPDPEIRLHAHEFLTDPAGYDCGICLKQGQNLPIFLTPQLEVWVEDDVFHLTGCIVPMCSYGHSGIRLFTGMTHKITANMIAADTITAGQLIISDQVRYAQEENKKSSGGG